MCGIGDTRKTVEKKDKWFNERWNKGTAIENDKCYAQTPNITYLKQHQQDNQM